MALQVDRPSTHRPFRPSATKPVSAAPADATPAKEGDEDEPESKVAVQLDALNLPDVWTAGYTGKGVGIAVIDSGLSLHADLRSHTVAFKDFVNENRHPNDDADPASAYDDAGHGTMVSTVAAGDGTNGICTGAAPGANIISLKAVDAGGMAWSSNVVKAIQWAVDNKERYNIRVLNMSFYLDDPDLQAQVPVLQAIDKAAAAGIIPVAAASNDGPGPRTLHTIASYPRVVTVAASNVQGTSDMSDDTIAYFSSRGPGDSGQMKPDATAPGVNVTVGTVDGTYREADGTSFASPIAAGVIATWIEANPSLTVDDVQDIIADTSRPIDGYAHYDQGYGQIDAMAGLQKAIEMGSRRVA